MYGEEGYPQSLHSVSSTPSRADSDWPYSDVEADESRKKILSQLQKLNDKRARLEAQLTRIQKGQSIATKLPDAPVFRADTLLSAHVRYGLFITVPLSLWLKYRLEFRTMFVARVAKSSEVV